MRLNSTYIDDVCFVKSFDLSYFLRRVLALDDNIADVLAYGIRDVDPISLRKAIRDGLAEFHDEPTGNVDQSDESDDLGTLAAWAESHDDRKQPERPERVSEERDTDIALDGATVSAGGVAVIDGSQFHTILISNAGR